MRRLYPDLWQTAQQKQFSTLNVHGYLLERPEGNALFYNPRSTGDFEAIADVGGVSHHYLTHCHEVSGSLVDIAQRFGSELCCHVLVERYLSGTLPADVYFNSPDTEMHRGVEVIHTPGHTDNSVCYRYRSPHGKTYLFTGDTLYLDADGEWATIVVSQDGGNHRDLAGSLALLRGLDVDVVICSVSLGEMRIVEVTRPEWHSIIDELIRPLAGA